MGGTAPRAVLPVRHSRSHNPSPRPSPTRRPRLPNGRRARVPASLPAFGQSRRPCCGHLLGSTVAPIVQWIMPAMLKITLHDSADEFRFRLEGKLSGAWVNELRQCWLTASSTTQGRRTVLDMREVDFVDDAAESLICDMTGAGVLVQVSSPFMQSVMDGISRGRGYGTVEETPPRSCNAVVSPHPSGRHSRAI